MEKRNVILTALAILGILNGISFVLMRYDKRCARAGRRRVPEKTLFLAAACFGGLGMRLFRHKTRHARFILLFSAMLAAQTVLLGAGIYLLSIG